MKRLSIYTQRDLLIYVLLYAVAFGFIAVLVHYGEPLDEAMRIEGKIDAAP